MNWHGGRFPLTMSAWSAQAGLLLALAAVGGCQTAPREQPRPAISRTDQARRPSDDPAAAAPGSVSRSVKRTEPSRPPVTHAVADRKNPTKTATVRTAQHDDPSPGAREPNATPVDSTNSTSDPEPRGFEAGARRADDDNAGREQDLLLPAAHPEVGERDIFPVDLISALRLADAQNLTIEIARNQLEIASAVESRAQVLWLPDIEFNPGYSFNSGTAQRAIGEIIETRRNSLRVRGGPVLAVDVAEAIYARLVARQHVQARAAGIDTARNRTLAEVGEAYFDMLAAFSAVSIAVETREHADRLAALTQQMLESGLGLASDAARAQAELQVRRQLEILARAQTVTSSAALARRLQMDARVQFAPVETTVVPLSLVPASAAPDALVDVALQNRPELAEQRALVGAADWSAEQARLLPLIPQLVIGYQAGGFGGGYTGDPQGFFGKFGSRTDFEASAVWELKNLGLGNRYQVRQRELELTNRQLALRQTIFRVMEEVVSDHQIVASRFTQLDAARLGVKSALDSYTQNIDRIERGVGLPIEALQALQALQRARSDYLQAVTEFNRAQFRLFADLGYAAVDAEPLDANAPRSN